MAHSQPALHRACRRSCGVVVFPPPASWPETVRRLLRRQEQRTHDGTPGYPVGGRVRRVLSFAENAPCPAIGKDFQKTEDVRPPYRPPKAARADGPPRKHAIAQESKKRPRQAAARKFQNVSIRGRPIRRPAPHPTVRGRAACLSLEGEVDEERYLFSEGASSTAGAADGCPDGSSVAGAAGATQSTPTTEDLGAAMRGLVT